MTEARFVGCLYLLVVGCSGCVTLNKKHADSLSSQANELADRKKFKEAVGLERQAFRADRHALRQFNIAGYMIQWGDEEQEAPAACEKYMRAVHYFRRFLRNVAENASRYRDDKEVAERVSKANARIAAIQERCGPLPPEEARPAPPRRDLAFSIGGPLLGLAGIGLLAIGSNLVYVKQPGETNIVQYNEHMTQGYVLMGFGCVSFAAGATLAIVGSVRLNRWTNEERSTAWRLIIAPNGLFARREF